MNLLPRLLGLSLIVVLAALTALLSTAVWRGGVLPPRLAAASHLAEAGLAALALTLAVAFLFTTAARRDDDRFRPPLRGARAELGVLTRLAENSTAQGVALAAERSGRQRAQEDALLRQGLLSRSLEERVRLGRDLHDGLIQSLYATGLTLETARTVAPENPAEADRLLAQSVATLNAAIRDVRAHISGLTADSVRGASFAQALAAQLEELRAGRDAQFDLKVDEECTARLAAEQVADLLQIAREAVSNALRHGGASLVTVRLHGNGREVCVLVQDNGTGFDAERPGRDGHGLGNMKARAEKLGATLRLTSQPGGGTRVLLTLALSAPA